MIPRGFRLCATVFQSFQARPLSTTSRTRVRFAVSAALLITQSIACVLDYVCAAAPHSQQTCHQALLLLLALVAVLLCPPPVPVFYLELLSVYARYSFRISLYSLKCSTQSAQSLSRPVGAHSWSFHTPWICSFFDGLLVLCTLQALACILQMFTRLCPSLHSFSILCECSFLRLLCVLGSHTCACTLGLPTPYTCAWIVRWVGCLLMRRLAQSQLPTLMLHAPLLSFRAIRCIPLIPLL